MTPDQTAEAVRFLRDCQLVVGGFLAGFVTMFLTTMALANRPKRARVLVRRGELPEQVKLEQAA